MSNPIPADTLHEQDEVFSLEKFKDHTDPKYIGPGTWIVLHKRSFDAVTEKEQKAYIELVESICYNFGCSVCRGHCTEYIKNHPLEDYLNVEIILSDGSKKVLGMFLWTWKFHNAVNARLKKPIMSWDTAYNLYSGKMDLVCSSACTDAEKNLESHHSESHHTIPPVPPTTPQFKLIKLS